MWKNSKAPHVRKKQEVSFSAYHIRRNWGSHDHTASWGPLTLEKSQWHCTAIANLSEIMVLTQTMVLSHAILEKGVGLLWPLTVHSSYSYDCKKRSLSEEREQEICKQLLVYMLFPSTVATGQANCTRFLFLESERSNPTSQAVEKMMLSNVCKILCIQWALNEQYCLYVLILGHLYWRSCFLIPGTLNGNVLGEKALAGTEERLCFLIFSTFWSYGKVEWDSDRCQWHGVYLHWSTAMITIHLQNVV